MLAQGGEDLDSLDAIDAEISLQIQVCSDRLRGIAGFLCDHFDDEIGQTIFLSDRYDHFDVFHDGH